MPVANLTVDLSRKEWVAWTAALRGEFMPAALRGARAAGLRSVAALHKATGEAPPASKNGSKGAVNTGFYKRAWKSSMVADGSVVHNGATYAGVIEHGRRAGSRMPPTKMIARWIQRRLGKSEKEAAQMAFVVARSIAKRGLGPRKVLTSTLPQMQGFLNEEVLRELTRTLSGGR